MATYDHGGGCSCGLYKECQQNCEHNILNQLSTFNAHTALMNLIRLTQKERKDVLKRLEELLCLK